MATFIAHGDVALSVLMTTASTLGAIIMTPTLTRVLAGTLVPVDAWVSSCLNTRQSKPRALFENMATEPANYCIASAKFQLRIGATICARASFDADLWRWFGSPLQ